MKISKKVKELFSTAEMIDLYKELIAKRSYIKNLKQNKVEDKGEATLWKCHIIDSNGKFNRYEIFIHGSEYVYFDTEEKAEQYLSDNDYILNTTKSNSIHRKFINKKIADKYSAYQSDLKKAEDEFENIYDQLENNIIKKISENEKNFPIVYIRFGKIPESGKSYNFRDRFFEDGVSTFKARKIGINYIIDVAGGIFTYGGYVESKTAYLIDGDLLETTGSDGEPLLSNVKIVKKLNPNNFYFISELIEELYSNTEK